MQISKRTSWAVAFVVFGITLFFALYTNHAWEDWYITYRASKNLAMGYGLVYTIGQRVHSFTSPLGTLIPALFRFVLVDQSDDMVLWCFRILCCGLRTWTAVLLLRSARSIGLHILPTAVLIGLFVFDAKMIDFSINGQETALMLFFLAYTFYVLSVPVKHPNEQLGLAWGGLMWTRPDSFVYIIGIALGYFLFAPKTPHSLNRKELFKIFVQAGIVAAVVYLPWFLWAWAYYGTPVPHTVIAKGLFLNRFDVAFLVNVVSFPFNAFFGQTSLVQTFFPGAYIFGGWPFGLKLYCHVVALICTFVWMFPRVNPTARAISFACFLAHFYLTMDVVYPWYIPNVAFLSVIVLGLIFHQVYSVILKNETAWKGGVFGRFAKAGLYSLGSLLLVMSFLMTIAHGFEMKIQQEVIENGNRKQIGLWLKENAHHPTDTVFLEPLGYIGFYSQLKMLDYPGLSSPEVVAARRKLGPNIPKDEVFAGLIRELSPDWLVLRPFEAGDIAHYDPQLLVLKYQLVKMFDVSKQIQSYAYIPGRPYLKADQTFFVFKKKEAI